LCGIAHTCIYALKAKLKTSLALPSPLSLPAALTRNTIAKAAPDSDTICPPSETVIWGVTLLDSTGAAELFAEA
jgi:hypothetical protein